MILRLAYGNVLKLPDFNTYREREEFIIKHFLHSKKLVFNEKNKKILETNKNLDSKMTIEEFYNIRSLVNRTAEQEKQMRDRWLYGVDQDDSVKEVFNNIANYLFSAKDITVKPQIKRFKQLMRKLLFSNKKLEQEEINELRKLRKSIIGYRIGVEDKEDFVFMTNEGFEKVLRSTIKKTKDKALGAYLQDRYNLCIELKDKAKVIGDKIDKLQKEVANNYTNFSKLYQDMRKSKGIEQEKLFSDIDELITKTIKTKHEISELEEDLYYITDDYMQITELQQNFH